MTVDQSVLRCRVGWTGWSSWRVRVPTHEQSVISQLHLGDVAGHQVLQLLHTLQEGSMLRLESAHR